jgi:hypothetical protein
MDQVGAFRMVNNLVHQLLIALEKVLVVIVEKVLIFSTKLGVDLTDDPVGATDETVS